MRGLVFYTQALPLLSAKAHAASRVRLRTCEALDGVRQ